MQTAVDPFQPLLSVVQRYRNDVHNLRPPATEEALAQAAQHLSVPIPRILLRFLHRWNGAVLFRGVLQIRTVADLASAADNARSVIVFADGPSTTERWAYAPNGQGNAMFGRWDGSRFTPLHERFDRWLDGTIRILDNDIRGESDRLDARLEADPDCGFLLLAKAEAVLANGDPETARDLLRRATANDPGLVPAWERLGDTLMGEDTEQARWSYLKALRAIRLPAPFPTIHGPSPALITTLGRLFPPGDPAWERELTHLLDEAIVDVGSYDELAFVEAAASALGRSHLGRHDRGAAHAALVDIVERAQGFQIRGPMSDVVLQLARIEADLGHHDDAERRLRTLRIAPPPLADKARLVIGTIAASRQEPWSDEILTDALKGLEDPDEQCEALIAIGERKVLQDQHEEAKASFEEALEITDQTANHVLAARATLGLGDLSRLQGDIQGAASAYQQSRELAGDDPVLLQRVLIRRGDLFRMQDDRDRALADYARAADEYANLQLPIREAWARLRMAQAGSEGAAEQAHLIFKTADHAAGVAATDAISGNPTRSLDWHLNRAASHARDRANAQRARPPLTRADAERPERRMGAHRTAVSACSVQVVHHLVAEMDVLSKTLELASPRSTDPNLARYVAATDLLSAHRSYEAAAALLRHLLQVRTGGLAGRSLIGAMARSPNAALVDGLLEALDGNGEPTGIAAAAEILGWRREAAATDQLRKRVRPGANPIIRRAALVALGRIGDPAAIDDLLPVLEDADLAEATSVALLLLGEWRGVDYQAQALANQRPGMSRSLGEIVGRYGGPSYLLLLFRAAELEGAAGLGALQGLGYLGEPKAVDRLLDATANRDFARARVASGALELITGHHEDPEESLLRNRWVTWWDEHGHHFESGFRYRHGRLMDPGLLIDRLSHDDPLVRRATYDELVIATGQRRPFDAEGPYRVQVQHIAEWRSWWHQSRDEFPSGRWTFHGEQVG
jgi:tetratricopeptide (TPR) repeat protein